MVLFSFYIFVATCIFIIVVNLREKDGMLRAPTVAALISLFSIGPQMIQTIVNPFFNKSILPLFFIFISSCLICFHLGFLKGTKMKQEVIKLRQLESGRNKYVCIVFCIFGLIALLAYKGTIGGMDWVIAGFLQSFGVISIFLSFNELKNFGFRDSKLYIIILLISLWCIIDYAFNIKGSRTRIFYIIIFSCLYLSRIYPIKAKLICNLLLYTFIIGSVASFSMGDYRKDIDKPFLERISLNQIVENYKLNLFGQIKVSLNGQDLYNGAQYADYCWGTGNYNFGLFIWNGLVFNYIPQRFVGQEVKDSLMSSLENRKKVNSLTHGVTTVTGFGEAFAAYSIFGGVIFYLIAFFFGRWWQRSFISDFYLLLYAYSIMYLAPLITHGIVYFISPIVLFWIVIYPILRRSIYYIDHENPCRVS